MNARPYAYAVRLLVLSLMAVSPGAFSSITTSTVQFITDVYGRNENAGDAALTVIRNGDTNTGCSVNWSVTGGSATALNDYSPTSGTLNFAAGETFKNISLLIVDDALVESNETVNLTLSGAVNATITFPSNAVLTIFDNDVSNPPPVIQFVSSVYGRFEDQTAPLNLERVGDTNVSCSVQWSFTGGTAAPFSDFFGGSSTINFAAGQTIAALPISIIDDAVAEPDETASFVLQNPFNATLGSPTSATLTIYDNDVSNPPPATVVQFVTDTYGRNENTGDASLTVTRSGNTSNACSVNWSVTGGSATAPADYSPTSGTLNFAAFETFKNISLLIVDDALVESNETVNLTLSGAVNATIGFPSNAVLTIFDNDVSNPPPVTVVQFITDTYGRNENAGDASLTVTRSGNTSNACSVNWSVTGGSATAPADYSPTSGTLNFAAFETFKNISLFIVDDALVESNETVNLTLSGAVNATIGFPSNAVLTIFDNDVTLSADLQITKTVNSNFVTVGQTVVFQLALFNGGPNNLSNSITVSEVIPSGFQYVSDTSAASGTTYSAGLGQWTIPNGLGSGSNLFLNITVQAINTGIYTNMATVIAPNGVNDPNTNNNSASAVVTVSNPPPAQADLQITKTASASGLPVGSNVVFNLVLRNNGPATVTNQVIVTEVIPSGFDYVGDNSAGSGNYYSFGLGQWVMPTGIVAGATQSVAITVRALTTGTYTNTALINVPNGVTDPNTNNNSSFVLVNITNPPPVQADLQITKTASTNVAVIGQLVVFHLVLRNNGPDAVTNAFDVGDVLPSGFQYSSNTASAGTAYSLGQGRWLIFNGLASNATLTLDIATLAGTNGIFTNTALIIPPPGLNDPNTNNNVSRVVVTNVLPQADLSIVKFLTASNINVHAGDQVSFTLIVSNAGPTAVSNVLVPDVLDAGMQVVFASQGTNAVFGAASNTFTILSLATNERVTIELRAALTGLGLMTNRVSVLVPPMILDTNTSNNVSFAYVNAAPAADLQITKTANSNNVPAGSAITFTIQLRNAGPNTSSNMVVRDLIPPGTTLVTSNVPVDTTFNSANGQWTVPRLVNGESRDLGLTLIHPTGATVTNVAWIVSSPLDDPTPLDRTNSVVATWLPTDYADLSVIIRLQTNAVLLGQTTRVEYVVSNLGPRDASNAMVYAPLPPGVELVGLLAVNWSYNTNTAVWTRTNAMASPGASILAYDVRATNAGLKTFTALLTNSQPVDPFLGNNSATTNFIAGTAVNIIGVVKCATNGPALAGAAITLTSSNGTSRTTFTDGGGVFAFAALPPGFYTITPSKIGFSFAPTNQTVDSMGGTTNLPLFLAIARNISGEVRTGPNGSGVPGIIMQLTGAATATQPTDNNGAFNFVNLNPGTYTVTPLTNGVPFARFTPTNATFVLGNPTNWTNSITFYLPNKVVVLRALEAVQVSQDWENSVPLVTFKRTRVRAHLELPGTNRTAILVEGARLFGTNLLTGASANWTSSDRPAPARVNVWTNDASAPLVRSNYQSAVNFTLPDEWATGRVSLRFEWTNGVVLNREPAEADGGGTPNDGTIRVAFTNMPALAVKFVRVAWTNAVTRATSVPTVAAIDEEKLRLTSIYPISSLAPVANGYMFWSRTNGAPRTSDRRDAADEDLLLEQLIALRTTSRDTNTNSPIYYGAVANKVLRGVANLANGSGAIGNISRRAFDYQRHIAAHELGHTLQRQHAVHSVFGVWTNDDGTAEAGSVQGHCREYANAGTTNFPMDNIPILGFMPVLGPMTIGANKQVWGYDSYSETLINPYSWFDVMSYCYEEFGTANWPWMSKYTFTNIQNRIINLFGPAGAPPPALASPKSSPGNYLLLRGQVSLAGTNMTWRPTYPFVSDTTPPLPAPGDYSLLLLDQFNVPLLEIPFQPNVSLVEWGFVPDTGTFSISVPANPLIAHAIVLRQGIPLGQLNASANPPTVQVLFPNGGEAFGNAPINVQWVGSDLDGDPLWYLIQFSPDNGVTWQTIAIDLDGTDYTIPEDALPATTQGRIRVIASDGFRSGMDASDGAFVVLNHAPAVAILSPVAGELYFGQQSIIFDANANDLDDGTLSGTNVVWRSDRDGLLGTGSMLLRDVSTLSEGAHVVTVTAIDSGGLTNTATVTVNIAHEEPPRLAIERMLPDVLLSWPIAATNYHLQGALSLPGAWSDITNTVQTVGDKAQVTLPAGSPAKFFRLTKP